MSSATEVLTGYAPAAGTGRNPYLERATAIELTPADLPKRIVFNGRRYVMNATPRGGLILKGEDP